MSISLELNQVNRKVYNLKKRSLLRGEQMLVFGVDVPLVELILAFAVIMFILLFEVIVVLSIVIRQLNKTKKQEELLAKLSEILLDVKKAEIEELDKLKKK